MLVSLDELTSMIQSAIASYGYSDEEAKIILEVILYSQLRGGNQGVVKLIGPGIPKDPISGPIAVERETRNAAVVNGNNMHAMLVVSRATAIAREKAEQNGIAIVGVHHLNTSSGSIGYYARLLAEVGLIGIVMAGASPVVAPEGSFEPLLGTNPIAIALPGLTGPVVLDMATAVMPFFGVIEAQTAGRALPSDSAFDSAGRPTTDPSEALKGALRTFDRGPKGSGLSFMVQALTGPLVGASSLGMGDVSRNWGGHLIIAIDPALQAGRQALQEGVDAMVKRTKDAKRLPGVQEVYVPGERGDRLTARVRAAHQIELEDNLFRELKEVAARSKAQA